MANRFLRASLERARNAAVRGWSRLRGHSPFGMRDLDGLRHRLEEANRQVAECQALVTGWTEFADREIVGRELLNAFEADLKAAIRSKEKAEAALKRRLHDIFAARTVVSPRQIRNWRSGSPAEGKAATAFEPTPLAWPSYSSRGRRAMPLRFIGNASFDPDTTTAMTTAFDDARLALGLADKDDPLAQILAKKIVEIATLGERDPKRICELALQNIRS
jgi:hypothetical protein